MSRRRLFAERDGPMPFHPPRDASGTDVADRDELVSPEQPLPLIDGPVDWDGERPIPLLEEVEPPAAGAPQESALAGSGEARTRLPKEVVRDRSVRSTGRPRRTARGIAALATGAAAIATVGVLMGGEPPDRPPPQSAAPGPRATPDRVRQPPTLLGSRGDNVAGRGSASAPRRQAGRRHASPPGRGGSAAAPRTRRADAPQSVGAALTPEPTGSGERGHPAPTAAPRPTRRDSVSHSVWLEFGP